jgi:hypothetical protein
MSLVLLIPGVGMGGGGSGPSPIISGTWIESGRLILWIEKARLISWQEYSRITTWESSDVSTLTKRALEIRLYEMDLSLLPEMVAGDTVASVTSVTAATTTPGASPSDLTFTNEGVASGNEGAQVEISGGIDGATYQISFEVLTTHGYTLVGIGYLYVDDR